MHEEKLGIKARLLAELKTMFTVFLYLAALLGAFTTYRRLILGTYEISYLHYGYSIIEALVLSKVVVFGSALGLGERFKHRPLIYPTLYKTLSFSILVLVFTLVEHLVMGLIHRQTLSVIIDEILNKKIGEILASVLVILVAFVPMFAIWETGRALGDKKLYDLFFKQR